jgi:CHAD domain-containing protein
LTSNRKAVELRNLRQIQDILGEIHDYDIMINYLTSLTDKYQLVHVLESEISERRKKYRLFISSFSKTKSDLF